ncbi:MAG TPA: Clp protease N-terminal domain-containing protein [Jatrophihabitantaceae bacterium]|nr:Clp protease N-terminal domain-containing protein [Jatrophihabitantaceae bacterium]
MFEQFTNQARHVVVFAQEESRELRHSHIGTEHLLLGLLSDEDDATGQALVAVGATRSSVSQQLERSVGRGAKEPSGHIPFTPRAKQVLEAALRASQRLGHAHIGRPHLLRGLLDVSDGTAARLLAELGVDREQLAATADTLAEDDVETEDGLAKANLIFVRRGAAAGPWARMVPRRRRLGGDEAVAALSAQVDLLARRRGELLIALRRYGRHEDRCDPGQGCSCGLDAAMRPETS